MPNLRWRASGAVPPERDDPLDVLMTTGQLPPDAAPGLEPVEETLAALRAGPSAGELAGKARVMAEFRGTVGLSRRPAPAQPWSLATLHRRAGFRFAAAAAAVVAAAAGAAYSGSLPAPVQNAAHHAFGAPAAGAGVTDGSGRRAPHGHCDAYRHASQHGEGAEQGAAFYRLGQTVGNVAAHCHTVQHSGASAGVPATATEPDPEPRGHPAGKGSQDSGHDRAGDHAGHNARGRGWPGPTAREWPGSSAGVAPRPHAGQRPGGQAKEQPGRARTAASSRTYPHREATCGSAPGAQRSSRPHPPVLSGQNGGC